MFYGIGYGCGYVLKNPDKKKTFFVVLSILIGVIFVLDMNAILLFMNLVVGVLISIFVFQYVFNNTKNIILSIMLVGMINFLYSVLRHFLFYNTYRKIIDLSLEQNITMIESYFKNSPEKIENAKILLESFSGILVNYSISLWTVAIVLGLASGSLVLSRNIKANYEIKSIKVPYFLVYGLISGLSLFIFPTTRNFGSNIVISISSLYLIQGISIALFFWWDYITRSKVLMWMTILAILMNPYILILITLVGIADIWFDIRKLNKSEEKNENNPNE